MNTCSYRIRIVQAVQLEPLAPCVRMNSFCCVPGDVPEQYDGKHCPSAMQDCYRGVFGLQWRLGGWYV